MGEFSCTGGIWSLLRNSYYCHMYVLFQNFNRRDIRPEVGNKKDKVMYREWLCIKKNSSHVVYLMADGWQVRQMGQLVVFQDSNINDNKNNYFNNDNYNYYNNHNYYNIIYNLRTLI